MQSFTPTKTAVEARLRASLPPRLPDSHKGSYGNALLYCGSRTYTGAACLAAMGALRAGAGITHLLAPEEALAPVRIRLPEVVCHPIAPLGKEPASLAGADRLGGRRGAILIGCGLGRGTGSEAAAFCEALLSLLSKPGLPLVLDADALNMLADHAASPASFLSQAVRPVILTPHPTEFSRLSGLPVEEIQKNRACHATAFAGQSGCILLLKGHGTVIATPAGEATVNPSGSPALAKGGSGDVLAGVITGLIAGGMAPAEAALAGAYLHGLAGERLAARDSAYGLLPSDLPAAIAGELCRITSDDQ